MKDIINYSNIELFRDIWGFILPYKKKFFIGTFIRITSDLVWLYPAWALSEMISFASQYSEGSDTSYAWKILGILFVIGMYHFIAHDVCKYFIYQVAENANIDAQKKTTQHLYSLDMQWHEKENSGNKMQKVVKGGASLNRIIRSYVDLVIESIINIIAITFILSFINIYFSLILVLFFVMYYFLSYYFLKKAVAQSHVVNLEEEKFTGVAFESINNISVIKSLHINQKIFIFLENISKKLVQKIKKRIFYFRKRGIILHLFHHFVLSLLVAFTLFEIFNGNLEVGILAMVIFYFQKIKESASEFAETYNQFISAKINMFRMKEILREKPTIENSGTEIFNPNWKTLSFQNVSFSYHGHNVLENFSIDIKKGEKIGIVGISGTGKSTLFKLILKLYNGYTGKIVFDKKELQDIKRESYIQKIAIVPQETELFNLSLKDNIMLSSEKNNTIQLNKSLEIAHINDFSHKLSNGIDSLIGEKGIKLSGGEKQRVGIARAVYKNPEILLLDEATSHLDILSEQKIQEALHYFFQNITAIVIAHRLSTIKEMDRIVVMDRGKVLEIGSFQELIEKKGAFFQLWEKQKF